MSKTIYVSVPLEGLSREDINEIQHNALAAAGEYLNEEVELIENYLDNDLTPLECLAENLKLMAKADYAVFINGFENDKGCRIERTCAEAYGLTTLYAEQAAGGDNNGSN